MVADEIEWREMRAGRKASIWSAAALRVVADCHKSWHHLVSGASNSSLWLGANRSRRERRTAAAAHARRLETGGRRAAARRERAVQRRVREVVATDVDGVRVRRRAL